MKWMAAALCLLATPALAEERIPVQIELVLALDSSASVDRAEFQLQLDVLRSTVKVPNP